MCYTFREISEITGQDLDVLTPHGDLAGAFQAEQAMMRVRTPCVSISMPRHKLPTAPSCRICSRVRVHSRNESVNGTNSTAMIPPPSGCA